MELIGIDSIEFMSNEIMFSKVIEILTFYFVLCDFWCQLVSKDYIIKININ